MFISPRKVEQQSVTEGKLGRHAASWRQGSEHKPNKQASFCATCLQSEGMTSVDAITWTCASVKREEESSQSDDLEAASLAWRNVLKRVWKYLGCAVRNDNKLILWSIVCFSCYVVQTSYQQCVSVWGLMGSYSLPQLQTNPLYFQLLAFLSNSTNFSEQMLKLNSLCSCPTIKSLNQLSWFNQFFNPNALLVASLLHKLFLFICWKTDFNCQEEES